MHAEVIRLSKPVASDAVSETFGGVWDPTNPQLTLSDALAKADKLVGKPIIVSTKIGRVCQKKGCFFIAQSGEDAVRVSFRDYGFFIPTDTAGKEVELAGVLVRTAVSVEQAAHFTTDAKGPDGLFKSGDVFEIVANGVRIPR